MCFRHGQGLNFTANKLSALFLFQRASLPRLICLVPLARHFVKYPELSHSPWRIAEPTRNPFSNLSLRSWRHQGERHKPCSQRPPSSKGEVEQRANDGLSTDTRMRADRGSIQMKREWRGGTT